MSTNQSSKFLGIELLNKSSKSHPSLHIFFCINMFNQKFSNYKAFQNFWKNFGAQNFEAPSPPHPFSFLPFCCYLVSVGPSFLRLVTRVRSLPESGSGGWRSIREKGRGKLSRAHQDASHPYSDELSGTSACWWGKSIGESPSRENPRCLRTAAGDLLGGGTKCSPPRFLFLTEA